MLENLSFPHLPVVPPEAPAFLKPLPFLPGLPCGFVRLNLEPPGSCGSFELTAKIGFQILVVLLLWYYIEGRDRALAYER